MTLQRTDPPNRPSTQLFLVVPAPTLALLRVFVSGCAQREGRGAPRKGATAPTVRRAASG
jgi:hypothetical protein